jgi:hypothetical protein
VINSASKFSKFGLVALDDKISRSSSSPEFGRPGAGAAPSAGAGAEEVIAAEPDVVAPAPAPEVLFDIVFIIIIHIYFII